MNLPRTKTFRSRQTLILFSGILLGYLVFVLWLRPRPVVILSGGVITSLTLISWFWQFRQVADISGGINFLNKEQFNAELSKLQTLVPPGDNPNWKSAKLWAEQSQIFAQKILQKEGSLTPELAETLYTVMDLTRQVAEALNVQEQIQTPVYKKIAAQRLHDSCDRLEQTYLQLQELQDQVTIASLDQRQALKSALPQRLESLISANKTILNAANTE